MGTVKKMWSKTMLQSILIRYRIFLCAILIIYILTCTTNYDGLFYADEKVDVDYVDGEEMEARISKLKRKCGDLCNTNKQIEDGEFLGTVKSEVDCPNLFSTLNEFSVTAPRTKPSKWKQLSEEIQNHYNHEGRAKIKNWFIDQAFPEDVEPRRVFTKEFLEE